MIEGKKSLHLHVIQNPPMGQILSWLGLNYSFYFSNNSTRYILNREDNWDLEKSINVPKITKWPQEGTRSQKYWIGQKVHLGFPLTSYRKIWTNFFDQPSRSIGTTLLCGWRQNKKQPFEKCGNKRMKLIKSHIAYLMQCYISITS